VIGVGEALVVARTAAGITQQVFADQLGITQAALSRYENNLRGVPDETLDAAAEILGVTRGLLITAREHRGAMAVDAHMRRRATAPATAWHRTEARLNMLRVHTAHVLAEISMRASKQLPVYDPIDTSPAEAARYVRMQWQMPSGPVRNLIQWAEAAGCIVFEEDFGTSRVDGMSQWIVGHPVLLINSTAPVDRKRLTIAHELGHLCLHNEFITETVETDANQFAAEFLMPESAIAHQLRDLTIGRLGDLKQVWGVSMQALIERAFHLGFLTAAKRTLMYKQFSARGWRVREPGSDALLDERPTLQAAIGATLAERGLSPADIDIIAGFQPGTTINPFRPIRRTLTAVN
jgi:Zn-dependent peptidase ImmA (M78 family)/transcriptional regulator with XRE-family HTH domain